MTDNLVDISIYQIPLTPATRLQFNKDTGEVYIDLKLVGRFIDRSPLIDAFIERATFEAITPQQG